MSCLCVAYFGGIDSAKVYIAHRFWVKRTLPFTQIDDEIECLNRHYGYSNVGIKDEGLWYYQNIIHDTVIR